MTKNVHLQPFRGLDVNGKLFAAKSDKKTLLN